MRDERLTRGHGASAPSLCVGWRRSGGGPEVSVVVVPSSAVISHQPSCRHNLLSLSTSIAKEGLRLHLHHSSPVRVSLLTCSPLFRSCVSNLLRVVARRFPSNHEDHSDASSILRRLPFRRGERVRGKPGTCQCADVDGYSGRQQNCQLPERPLPRSSVGRRRSCRVGFIIGGRNGR